MAGWVLVGTLVAQTPTAGARDAVSVQSFDRRGGMQSSAVYDLALDRHGLLWAATDDGAAYFTGHDWRQLDMPRAARSNQVRAILSRADGSLWFGTRAGIVRTSETDTLVYGPAEGVTDGVTGLLVTTVLGGSTIIATTPSGIAMFDGRRFVPVVIPELGTNGAVAVQTTGVAGHAELWVGSPTDGLFLLRQDRWARIGPDDGLYTFGIEGLAAVAQPGADGVRLFAAGADGVFALRGKKWERVAGAPLRAVRVAHVPRAEGDGELWVGTDDGRVVRRRADGAWGEVIETPGRVGAVTAIAPIIRGDGEASVYIGSRGDRLARVMLTRARVVSLPRSVAGHAVTVVQSVRVGRQAEIWLGTDVPGVVRITKSRTYIDRTVGDAVGAVHTIAQQADTVWVGGARGVQRRVGNRWRSSNRGLGQAVVRRIRILTDSTGAQVVTAATSDGVWHWRGERWVRADLRNITEVTDIAELRSDGVVRWFVATDGGQVWEVGGNLVHPTVTASPSLGLETVTDMYVDTLSDGRHRLWAATAGLGGIRYLDLDNPRAEWRLLNVDVREAFPSDFVRDLAKGPSGRLYAATTRGVVQLRQVTPDSIALETVYGEDEGLPSADVLGVAFDANGDLLAATRTGLGRLRPMEPRLADRSPLRLTVRAPDGPAPFDESSALDHGDANVVFDYSLLNYYREEDTRYRTELVGGTTGRTGWSDNHATSFSSLGPGRYVFRVWARDYRGEISEPREFSFLVRPPVWASPPAFALYALLAAGVLFLLYRWQTRVAHRRTLELAASERKFRALFERAFDAHLLVDAGVIVAANASAARLRGVSDPADLEGLAIRKLVPRLPRVVINGTRPALNTTMEIDVLRADARVVPVQLASTPMPIEESRHLVHLVLHDLSQQQAAARARAELEQQIQEAQKLEALGNLAGGIAHDFNNLLTVIRGTAELAMDREPANAPSQASLETILDAGNRARDLVRQILTFSRRSPRAQAPVDLGKLLREIERLIRSSVPTTIDIDFSVSHERLMVLGDPTQLQQIILNLCTNAEYAMREGGGTLTIALDTVTTGEEGRAGHVSLPPGRYARLVVADTGRGMPADVVARAFEPFFTTKPVGEGTGLGLAVLHGVVSSHRGSVGLSSESGVGTMFEVLLPSSLAHVSVPVPSALPAAAPLGGEGRLLLIDDDPDVLSVMHRLLERLGYSVTSFDLPDAALAWLLEHRAEVDLVITDQTMPGITGDRIVLEVRIIREDLPVIILTGFSHTLTVERVAALGAADVLYKPVDRGALVASINRVLAAPAAASPTERDGTNSSATL